jgi:hypothetical protein
MTSRCGKGLPSQGDDLVVFHDRIMPDASAWLRNVRLSSGCDRSCGWELLLEKAELV